MIAGREGAVGVIWLSSRLAWWFPSPWPAAGLNGGG